MDLWKMLQDAAQWWKHLLSTSGRKFNPGRCDVYIISWNFKEPQPLSLSLYIYIYIYTYISDKLINDLQKSVHFTIITSMGYSSHWSKEIRYDLHHHYSLKLQHLELEQFLCKVSSIHNFINHTDYKNIFENMIVSYQLASGILTPILKKSPMKCTIRYQRVNK